jgi:hypothetical protein
MFSFSSSIDNFIYVWDLKDTRSPAFTLPAVTGASQVILSAFVLSVIVVLASFLVICCCSQYCCSCCQCCCCCQYCYFSNCCFGCHFWSFVVVFVSVVVSVVVVWVVVVSVCYCYFDVVIGIVCTKIR